MTGRDRTVAIVFAVLAVFAAAWILLVSPERKQASKLSGEVATAQSQLSSAESQLSTARAAQAQYASAYSSIVSLGKAVPASQEVPSLIYQLEQASSEKNVDFASIAVASSTSASSPSAVTAAAAAGFTQMPFTFVFDGTYFDLEHLFHQLDRFTLRTSAGDLQVSGRLLTIQSVKLSPAASSEAGKKNTSQLTGTITATAYVLPASQGLTGAAVPGGAAPASAGGASGSSTAPAIIRVTP